MQPWSLSESRSPNAGAVLGASLMIAGGMVLLGSLLLPWERVDLQELFGVDIPSFTLTGFNTGIGKIAGILALGSATAGAITLALGAQRRHPAVPVAGLVSAAGAALVTIVGLFGNPSIGLVVGLGGAALSVIGAGVATAATARSGRGR